jgi:hypothetical protein
MGVEDVGTPGEEDAAEGQVAAEVGDGADRASHGEERDLDPRGAEALHVPEVLGAER